MAKQSLIECKWRKPKFSRYTRNNILISLAVAFRSAVARGRNYMATDIRKQMPKARGRFAKAVEYEVSTGNVFKGEITHLSEMLTKHRDGDTFTGLHTEKHLQTNWQHYKRRFGNKLLIMNRKAHFKSKRGLFDEDRGHFIDLDGVVFFRNSQKRKKGKLEYVGVMKKSIQYEPRIRFKAMKQKIANRFFRVLSRTIWKNKKELPITKK